MTLLCRNFNENFFCKSVWSSVKYNLNLASWSIDDALCFVLKIFSIVCVPEYMKTTSSWIYLFGISDYVVKKATKKKSNQSRPKKTP